MQKFVNSTLDEVGRLLLTKDVRESLEWQPDVALAIYPNVEDGMALLSEAADCPEGTPCTMDDHGRITIPATVLAALNWDKGTQIAISPAHSGHGLALVKVKG